MQGYNARFYMKRMLLQAAFFIWVAAWGSVSLSASGLPQPPNSELYIWATAYTDTLFDAEKPGSVIHPRVQWAVIILYTPSDDRQLAGRTYTIPGKPAVTILSPEEDKPYFESKIKGNGSPKEQKETIEQLQKALRLPEHDGLLTDAVWGAIFNIAVRSSGTRVDLPSVRLLFFRADPVLLPKYPAPLDGLGKQWYERDKSRTVTDKLPILPPRLTAKANAPNVKENNSTEQKSLSDLKKESRSNIAVSPTASKEAAISEYQEGPYIGTISYAGNWWMAVVMFAGLIVMGMGVRQFVRTGREPEPVIEEVAEPQDVPAAVEDLKAYLDSFNIGHRLEGATRPPVRVVKQRIARIKTLMESASAPPGIGRLIYRINTTAVAYTSASRKQEDVITAHGLEQLKADLDDIGPVLIRAANGAMTDEDREMLKDKDIKSPTYFR